MPEKKAFELNTKSPRGTDDVSSYIEMVLRDPESPTFQKDVEFILTELSKSSHEYPLLLSFAQSGQAFKLSNLIQEYKDFMNQSGKKLSDAMTSAIADLDESIESMKNSTEITEERLREIVAEARRNSGISDWTGHNKDLLDS